MILILIMTIIGVGIGFLIPFNFSAVYSMYLSVGFLAAIDSIFGAIRASYEDRFDLLIFISGIIINTATAMVLSFLGDKLGVPLYYAAIFVFGTRLFNNIAMIRRLIINKWREKSKDIEI